MGLAQDKTDRERPPVINDRSGVLDLKAAGGVGGRKYPLQVRQATHTSGVIEQSPAVRIPHV